MPSKSNGAHIIPQDLEANEKKIQKKTNFSFICKLSFLDALLS